MTSLRIFAAFLRRDWLIHRSYRATFVLSFVQPFATLFLVYYIAPLVDSSDVFARESGVATGYFGFVVVGIAVMGIFETGVSAFAETIRRDQAAGTLEVVLASPASPVLTMIGSAIFAFIRAIVGALLLVVAAVTLFGLDLEIEPQHVAALVGAIVACVVLFAAIGIVIAAIALVIKQTLGLVSFASLAITLLSGVYYPTAVLPGLLESVAEVLPFTWGIDVVRSVLLGGTLDELRLLGVTAAAVAAMPLAVLAFRWGFRRARRDGSLALY